MFEHDGRPTLKLYETTAKDPEVKLRSEVIEKTNHEDKKEARENGGVCLVKILKEHVFFIRFGQFQPTLWYSIATEGEASGLFDTLLRKERVPLDRHLFIHSDRKRISERRMRTLNFEEPLNLVVQIPLSVFLDSDERTLDSGHRDSHTLIYFLAESGCSRRLIKDAACFLSVLRDSGCFLKVLRDSGCFLSVLRDSGCFLKVLRDSGCFLSVLRDSGCFLNVLRDSGCFLNVLRDSGGVINLLRDSGCVVNLLRDSGGVINLPRDSRCQLHLPHDSRHSIHPPQITDYPVRQSIPCAEMRTTVATTCESLINVYQQKTTSSQEKRFAKRVLDADSSHRVQRNQKESPKNEHYNADKLDAMQFSDECERLSKERTSSLINLKELTQTFIDIDCQGNINSMVDSEKSESSCRKENQANVDKYNSLNVINNCSKISSCRDFTRHSPHRNSNKKDSSCSSAISSRSRMKLVEYSSKVDENCSDNTENRNNSGTTNKSGSIVNSNTDEENSDDSSASGCTDCTFSVDVERNETDSQIGDNPAELSPSENLPASSKDHTINDSVPPALDNSSNSTPTQADTSPDVQENIVCESFAMSSDRNKVTTFIQGEMFETNTTFPVTPSDVDITLERRLEDQQMGVNLANTHQFEPGISSEILLCKRKTNFPNCLELEMKMEHQVHASAIKSDGESILDADNACSNDCINEGTDFHDEDTVLTRHVYPVSNVGHCESTNQRYEGKDASFSRVYEGDIIFPSGRRGNVSAFGEDNTERNDKRLATSLTDELVCGDFTIKKVKIDNNKSFEDSSAHTARPGGHKHTLDKGRLTKGSSNEVRAVSFLNILTRKLLEIASNDTPSFNSVDVASAAAKDSELFYDLKTKDHEESLVQERELSHQKTSPRTVNPSVDYATSNQRADVTSRSQPNICLSAEAEVREGVWDEGTAQFLTVGGIHNVNSETHSQHGIRHVDVHNVNSEMSSQQDIRPAGAHNVNSKTPSLNQQQRYTSNYSTVQINKDQMFRIDSDRPISDSDRPIPDSDRLVSNRGFLTATEEQTATHNLVNMTTQDLMTLGENGEPDVSYKVDIFKSFEYASSISFGCSAKNTSNRTISCGQANFAEDEQSSRINRSSIGEISCSNVLNKERRQESCEASTICNVIEENGIDSKRQEDLDNYSRARLLRASQRRRKLMTEIEEITSCAAEYTLARSGGKNYRYAPRVADPPFDYTFSRQVAESESTIQSTDKRVVGTLTIEYLNPTVNGLVLLK